MVPKLCTCSMYIVMKWFSLIDFFHVSVDFKTESKHGRDGLQISLLI